MPALERELEEDEAELDNVLHKIMMSAEKLKVVADELGEEPDEVLREKFHLLSEAIYNLAKLADEIDERDMILTKKLEGKVKTELNSAIRNISDIKDMFE